MYSFIVFVNLILGKEKYILGSIGLYFLGEAELILRIWGAKENYFQAAEGFSFRDLGRLMHYFQGSREHKLPPGGLYIMKSIDFRVMYFLILYPSLSRLAI